VAEGEGGDLKKDCEWVMLVKNRVSDMHCMSDEYLVEDNSDCTKTAGNDYI
jgi:hypothetical protein